MPDREEKLQKKYVIFEDMKPLIFSAAIPHGFFRPLGRIISAGFVKFFVNDGEIELAVYGHSESLDLEAKPDDALIIRSMMGF